MNLREFLFLPAFEQSFFFFRATHIHSVITLMTVVQQKYLNMHNAQCNNMKENNFDIFSLGMISKLLSTSAKILCTTYNKLNEYP